MSESIYEAVPQELRQAPTVCFDLEHQDGRLTKVPRNPVTGK